MRRKMRISAVILASMLILQETADPFVVAAAEEQSGIIHTEDESVKDLTDMAEAEDGSDEIKSDPYVILYSTQEDNGVNTDGGIETDSIDIDNASAIRLPAYVTQEMCDPGYWYDKSQSSGIDIHRELMSAEIISEFNKSTMNDKATNMPDIENMPATFNADSLRSSLAAAATTSKKTLYADHVSVDPVQYYKSVADQIAATAFTGESVPARYAIAVRRTTVNNIPVNAFIGYSESDTDDEKTNSALNVNEPFVIAQKATVFDDDFYWGYSLNCTGWVSADDLAICDDKAQWIDAWKTEPGKDDFIVVTQNKITLEPSEYKPELSEIRLTLGTILKTVPEDQIPKTIDERGPWNNYVVYLPIRDDNGRYVRGIGLISQHYEVSTGFLKMDQAGILRIAFNNLGDRYGWGGMQGLMDCSLFTRNVYRCFGLELPRNTSWQTAIPGRVISLEGMSGTEKLLALKKMPAGTMLFFKGHIMMYIGTDIADGQEMAYVISDTGSLSDSEGELEVRQIFSVIINPLTARRRSGAAWLDEISAAVLPISQPLFDQVSGNILLPHKSSPIEGLTYASSTDSLPLDTSLQNSGRINLDFNSVGDGFEGILTATVTKGSKVTTKMPVKAVKCDKSTGKASIIKSSSLAVVTLNRSGIVTFEMNDGRTRNVNFIVESPKAQSTAIKKKLKDLKTSGAERAAFNVRDLFGTTINDGKLAIVKQKNTGTYVSEDGILMLDLGQKDTVRVRYTYLNKKYSMTITVK